MKIFLLNLLAMSLLGAAAAQKAVHTVANNQHAWIMYMGDHKIAPQWGLHLEAQLRRHDFLRTGQQLLLRAGLNYYPNARFFFTAGYCFVNTYPYGAFAVKTTFPEHRLWEQLQVKVPLSRVEWISRFRLEQRFSKLPVQKDNDWLPGDAVYTNRFRLLNRFSLPLTGSTIADNTLYAAVYDELFVSFGKNVAANFLDQNRAYAALGYKISGLGRLEAGFMEQTVFKPDGVKIEHNHTLQLALISNIDFFKRKK